MDGAPSTYGHHETAPHPVTQPRSPQIDANHLPKPGGIIQGAVPPSDLDAQMSILSSVFLLEGGRSVIDRVVAIGLEPKHFYGQADRAIWESILRVEADNKELGIVEVAGDLRDHGALDKMGGTPYLAQIAGFPYELTLVEGHARRVITLWKQREAIAFMQGHVARMYHPDGVTGQDLLEQAENKFFELAHEQRESSYEHASVIASSELKQMIEASAAGKDILGAPSGFPDLDMKTGGYMAGDLLIVAARPGVGKTSYGVSTVLLTTAPSKDDPEALADAAYFHSYEMPRAQIALRMVCSLAGVEFSKLRLNQLTRFDWDKLFNACIELQKHPIFIDDRPAGTVQELRANMRKIQRDIAQGRVKAKRLVLVVADYLQLMRGAQGVGREQEIASLSRGLKETAKQEKVCIMALAQLNRDVEKRAGQPQRGGGEEGGGKKHKRPQLSDLRESGSLENDADTIIFIYREKYYDPDANDEAELIIAKQRNGETCTVRVAFHGPTTTFRPLAKGYEEFEDFGEDGRQAYAYTPLPSHYQDPEEEN